MLKAGYEPEHPALLTELKVGLEAYDIVQRAVGVVLTELHHGKWLYAGTLISKSHGLERAECQRHIPPLCHYLNWHTALEYSGRLEFLQRRSLGVHQLMHEGKIIFPRHRAVQIVAAALVAGSPEHLVNIQRIGPDYGSRGIVKVQSLAEKVLYRLIQRTVGKRPGSNYGRGVWQFCYFLTYKIYIWV